MRKKAWARSKEDKEGKGGGGDVKQKILLWSQLSQLKQVRGGWKRSSNRAGAPVEWNTKLSKYCIYALIIGPFIVVVVGLWSLMYPPPPPKFKNMVWRYCCYLCRIADAVCAVAVGDAYCVSCWHVLLLMLMLCSQTLRHVRMWLTCAVALCEYCSYCYWV